MTTPYPPEDHVPEPGDHPDLLSEAPVEPGEPRVDVTLKGLPAARARALLAVLGRLEDGDNWVPPRSPGEALLVWNAASSLLHLESDYRVSSGFWRSLGESG